MAVSKGCELPWIIFPALGLFIGFYISHVICFHIWFMGKCIVIIFDLPFYRRKLSTVQILEVKIALHAYFIFIKLFLNLHEILYVLTFFYSLFPRYAFTASNPRYICWTGYKYWHCYKILVSLYTCGLCLVGSCSSYSMWVFIPLWLELLKHYITI